MHEPDYPSCMGKVVGFYSKHDRTPGEDSVQVLVSLQWMRVKACTDIAHWVTAGPALGLTCYVYGGRLNNQSPGQDCLDTGERPSHIPNLEYFLTLGSSTNDLGSLVHCILDGSSRIPSPNQEIGEIQRSPLVLPVPGQPVLTHCAWH